MEVDNLSGSLIQSSRLTLLDAKCVTRYEKKGSSGDLGVRGGRQSIWFTHSRQSISFIPFNTAHVLPSLNPLDSK